MRSDTGPAPGLHLVGKSQQRTTSGFSALQDQGICRRQHRPTVQRTGLAILLITTAMPHSLFPNLLRTSNSAALGQLPEQGFVKDFKIAAFVLAWINTLAIVSSQLHGPEENPADETK